MKYTPASTPTTNEFPVGVVVAVLARFVNVPNSLIYSLVEKFVSDSNLTYNVGGSLPPAAVDNIQTPLAPDVAPKIFLPSKVEGTIVFAPNVGCNLI